MKKFTTTLCIITIIITTKAQVGIETNSPSSTLDVTGKLGTTDLDGLQAPRLTRAQLTAKGNSLYGLAQTGALIYITNISGGDVAGQRVNITAPGYYYFDGSANIWQRVVSNVNDGGIYINFNKLNSSDNWIIFTANQKTDTTLDFYAPTYVGTAGSILQSNGNGSPTPTWTPTVTCSFGGSFSITHVIHTSSGSSGGSGSWGVSGSQRQFLSSSNTAEYIITETSGTSAYTLMLHVTFTGPTSKKASKVEGTLIVTDTQNGVSTPLTATAIATGTESSPVTSITFPNVSTDDNSIGINHITIPDVDHSSPLVNFTLSFS